MKVLILISAVLAISYAANYAVIIAGSNGFWNYRHQADTCHAYQTLTKRGIPAENIIHLSYDDVANSNMNPFPGKLYNKPDPSGPGVDVYEGCKIDYRRDDVTPENFLAVLTGDKQKVKGGNGRVLESTAEDNVFVNFADHGGTGILGFPVGQLLYSDDLIAALKKMHEKKMYKQLVFYLEACESGSMFYKILPNNLNIYATTAANPDESSWAAYCGDQATINGKSIGSCLGDAYSVNWMEDLDANDGSETLQQQFELVKKETLKSHCQQYGDLTFTNEPISTFLGSKAINVVYNRPDKIKTHHARDAKIHYLYGKYLNTSRHEMQVRKQWSDLLAEEMMHRQVADGVFMSMAATSLGNEGEKLLTMRMPPLNALCLKKANLYFENQCSAWSEYSMQYVNFFNNICMMVNDPETEVTRLIDSVC